MPRIGTEEWSMSAEITHQTGPLNCRIINSSFTFTGHWSKRRTNEGVSSYKTFCLVNLILLEEVSYVLFLPGEFPMYKTQPILKTGRNTDSCRPVHPDHCTMTKAEWRPGTLCCHGHIPAVATTFSAAPSGSKCPQSRSSCQRPAFGYLKPICPFRVIQTYLLTLDFRLSRRRMWRL
jgi:hypothetical protein